jgi:hypothetical protein
VKQDCNYNIRHECEESESIESNREEKWNLQEAVRTTKVEADAAKRITLKHMH